MSFSKFLIGAAALAVGGMVSVEAQAQPLLPATGHAVPRNASGEDPYYQVNRYGYGNYVRGPDGGLGGYPAGSAGSRQLEIYQELKCRYSPESC